MAKRYVKQGQVHILLIRPCEVITFTLVFHSRVEEEKFTFHRAGAIAHGYIPQVVGRKSEAEQKKRDPKKKACRWVVEACHGWFNRFRKLLVRYEKLEHTFLALNHLAAAIIAMRKIMLPVNVIYG